MKKFTITTINAQRIKLSITETMYKNNSDYIDETVSYFLTDFNDSGYFGFKDTLSFGDKLTNVDWKILETKTLKIDKKTYIVEENLDEEKAKAALVRASFNKNDFIQEVENEGYYIDIAVCYDINISTTKLFAEMNWKRLIEYGCYVSSWNNDLYYASIEKNTGRINLDDIQFLSFLPEGKEFDYLNALNLVLNTSYTFDDFENDKTKIGITIQEPKVFEQLENGKELTVEEAESLFIDSVGRILFRVIKTRHIVELELFTMNDSIRYRTYAPDVDYSIDDMIVSEDSIILKEGWLDEDNEDKEYMFSEDSIANLFNKILEESKEIMNSNDTEKKFFYTEDEKGNVVEKTTDKAVDQEIEDLLDIYEIDCYCYFRDGVKLKPKELDKLKEIGVTTYIGICARMHSESELKDFNATEKEIEISKYLIDIQYSSK